MSAQPNDKSISRRGFLMAAAATAVAATATGAGAAVLTSKSRPAAAPIISVDSLPAAPPAPAAAQTVLNATNDASDLLARLAAAQAENVRMQAELDSARRDLAVLRQQGSDSQSRSESLRLERESLQTELASASQRVGVLAGLVALYEQLDGIDVGATVEQGLDAVSTSLGELLEQAPTLTEGVAAGQQMLDDLEAHLPLLEEGRAWLGGHLDRLEAFYGSVEVVLQNVVESVAPVLNNISAWFEDVRKWLPFGLGQRAAEVVTALTNLIAETPETVVGLDAKIARPLDVWLEREGDGNRLQQNLIWPMREQVLLRAGATVAQAQQVDSVYQEQLSQPARAATESRRQLQEQIAIYRQTHQM